MKCEMCNGFEGVFVLFDVVIGDMFVLVGGVDFNCNVFDYVL